MCRDIRMTRGWSYLCRVYIAYHHINAICSRNGKSYLWWCRSTQTIPKQWEISWQKAAIVASWLAQIYRLRTWTRICANTVYTRRSIAIRCWRWSSQRTSFSIIVITTSCKISHFNYPSNFLHSSRFQHNSIYSCFSFFIVHAHKQTIRTTAMKWKKKKLTTNSNVNCNRS